jgi:hypothetical protein
VLPLASTPPGWLPSGALRDSELDIKAIDNLLSAATMRSKGTIDQMAATFYAETAQSGV